VSLSLYRPRHGFLERAHPTTRILAAIALFAPPFMTDDPARQGAYLALLLLGAAASRALGSVWRLKGIALAIFLSSLVLWTVTLPGATELWRAGPFALRQEALLLAAARATRLLSFLVVGAIFLTVTSMEAFAYGLRCLGAPYRACFAVTLAFRLAPLFLETAGQVANAQRARGLDLDRGGPLARGRKFLPLLAPILVAGFRRSDGLALALEAKGFSLPGRRTYFAEYPIGWRDALLLCLAILLNIGAYSVRNVRLY